MQDMENVRNLVGKTTETGDYLGHLVYYSIADERVSPKALAEAFAASGLEISYSPAPIEKVNAFKKACRRSEVKDKDGGEVRTNVLVRDVLTKGNRPVKQIVRELVDEDEKALQFTSIAHVELDDDGKLIYLPIVPMDEWTGTETSVLTNVMRRFEEELEGYDSQAIRRLVMAVLKDLNPVSMRGGGGIYFVSREHEGTIRKLSAFIRYLRENDADGRAKSRSQVMAIPLIDDDEYRQNVEENLGDQVQAESHEMIREIEVLMRTGTKISDRRRDSYIKKFRQVRAQIEEYQTTLHSSLSNIESNFELVERQMLRLIENTETAEETSESSDLAEAS